jgi:hypothetical protein
MKKILVLLCAVLVLTSCGNKNQQQNQISGEQKQNQGIFSSIRDAISKSITLRCEYVDESGIKSINYIKGNMIRVDNAETGSDQIKFSALVKDNNLYLWNAGQNQGLVFSLDKLQNSNDVQMGDTAVHSVDDIINELEAKKDQCHTDTISDSMFELPANVTFSSFNF